MRRARAPLVDLLRYSIFARIPHRRTVFYRLLTCLGTYAAEASLLLSGGVGKDAKGLYVRRRIWERPVVPSLGSDLGFRETAES